MVLLKAYDVKTDKTKFSFVYKNKESTNNDTHLVLLKKNPKPGDSIWPDMFKGFYNFTNELKLKYGDSVFNCEFIPMGKNFRAVYEPEEIEI